MFKAINGAQTLLVPNQLRSSCDAGDHLTESRTCSKSLSVSLRKKVLLSETMRAGRSLKSRPWLARLVCFPNQTQGVGVRRPVSVSLFEYTPVCDVLRGDMLWKLEINSFRGLEIGTLSQSRLFAAAFRKPSEC